MPRLLATRLPDWHSLPAVAASTRNHKPIHIQVCVFMWVRLFYASRTANGIRALSLQVLSVARKKCVATATAYVSSCCVFIAVAMNNQYVGHALAVSCVMSCCCSLYSPALLTQLVCLFFTLANALCFNKLKYVNAWAGNGIKSLTIAPAYRQSNKEQL